MIIDRKAQDPAIQLRNPGGYLRGMTTRAKEGKLNLHGSIFGLLKREGEHDA
jgi:replication initiation protein RepC